MRGRWRVFSRRVAGDERGQALIEFALVLPVLLILVLTLLVGGLLLLRHYGVTVAAREGARAAALGDPAAEQRVRDTLRAYGLDPSKPGTVVAIQDCYGGQYTCARVRWVADTIVPAFVFGGTGSELPLESVAVFRKEGP